MKPLWSLLFLLPLIFSCQNDSAPKQVTLPNTPALVAQQWVEAFYNDDFPKALALSTDITRMMIDSVKKELEPDANTIAFTISNVSCTNKGDSATCTYVYQEEQDRFEEYIDLIKQKGQWLVNESWDNSPAVGQEFEMFREELEKILEGEASKE